VSITLLIMALGIFLDVRLKTDKKRGILLYLVIMVSFILALLGMFALDAYLCHGEFVRMAEAWYVLYQSSLPIRYVFYHTQVSMIESFILVILAAFLIASFWNRKEQNASLWMFLLFLLAPTPLAAVGVLPYQVFSVFLWSVLAGIGLQQCFVIRVKPKALPTAEFRPIIEQEAKPEAEYMPEPERKPEAEPAPAPERKPEAESVPEPGTKPAIEPAHTPEPEAEPHPRFIENPLPLPKKHEKREMGYRFDE
ncbi:MAG: procyclic acidic repetitive family protein, partial [Lachnospiraceae bacterium]|nr:procyclic acidic repetitive family protein [Lachnospiraceae bacterium]